VQSIGIELGGTSILIALGKKQIDKQGNPVSIKIIEKKRLITGEPNETIKSMCEYINTLKFSEIGIASFGPICLNHSDPNYGYITMTPKISWQNFPLLKTIKSHLTFKNNISFDTDVNAPAMAEFLLGLFIYSNNMYLRRALSF